MTEELIHIGDCIEGMSRLKESSFNLIIADPPYNLSKDFGIWKEDEKRAEWKGWSREWLKAAHRVLSNQGQHLCVRNPITTSAGFSVLCTNWAMSIAARLFGIMRTVSLDTASGR